MRPRRKPRRGRPRDLKLHQRRREEILCKASEIFAELGYQETDVQFIADPLAISKGTIYRYFPSKKKLFLAAVERGVRCLDEAIKAAMEQEEDALARISAATRAYLEFFEKYPQLAELFIQERAVFRGRHRPIYFVVKDEARVSCRAMCAELIESGRLRPMAVDRVMSVMGNLMYGTMFTNYLSGRRKPSEQQAQEILDVVFHGILSENEKKRQL